MDGYCIDYTCSCGRVLQLQKVSTMKVETPDLHDTLPVCFELLPEHAIGNSNVRCDLSGEFAQGLEPHAEETTYFKPVNFEKARTRWSRRLSNLIRQVSTAPEPA
jgi:hypothetical protein